MHVVGDIAEVDNDRETLPNCLKRIAIGPAALKEAFAPEIPCRRPPEIVRQLRIKQRRFVFDLAGHACRRQGMDGASACLSWTVQVESKSQNCL